METVGTIPEGEFYSFNGVCAEEADFMAKLLGNCSLPSDAPNSSHYAIYSSHWPTHEPNVNIAGVDECSMYSDETNNSIFSFSQESNHSAGNTMLFPDPSCESYYPSGYNNFMTMDSGIHFISSSVIHGKDFLNQDVSNDSVECDENSPLPEIRMEDKVGSSSELSKKRPQIPREDLQKSKRSVKHKKCSNNYEDNKINNNTMIHKRTPSSSCSEDASLENSSCNLSGKTRASRGSATDPQSLYARKRRERINERLRILQNLVPNGTKVDISTMLEEAVQYVKFLQLQIKLLSSDDHWMYAPIAYNGMDIGLDRHLPSPTYQS